MSIESSGGSQYMADKGKELDALAKNMKAAEAARLEEISAAEQRQKIDANLGDPFSAPPQNFTSAFGGDFHVVQYEMDKMREGTQEDDVVTKVTPVKTPPLPHGKKRRPDAPSSSEASL